MATKKAAKKAARPRKTVHPWHLGNTTLRNPFRLREGLLVLENSPLEGSLAGKANESAFARALDAAEVVDIARADQDVSDLGRKWRSAFTQLGLITPPIAEKQGDQVWVGDPYRITPSGVRFLRSTTGSAIQEQLLRVLAAYCIPNPWEPRYQFERFNPLRHVLRLIQAVEAAGLEPKLTALEMAVIVPFTNGTSDLAAVVKEIAALREDRKESTNKKKFDADTFKAMGARYGYEPGTFGDYADLNTRYLKATGIFCAAGRGIAIAAERKLLADLLAAQTDVPLDDKSYIQLLIEGGALPTDDPAAGKLYLDSLQAIAMARGLAVDVANRPQATAADISTLAHEVEEAIFEDKEATFALEQAEQWEEIILYIDAILTGKTYPAGEVDGEPRFISVPKQERPAYLEWVLWRAFLAIDSLVNAPGHARKFNVDQEFLPMGCASGGQPDMVFEFEDFVMVCEVTLTTHSRQEAAEGEPVRRHVAKTVMEYGAKKKPVYGLFVAAKVDSNTAETFRIGSWYLPDDTRLVLDVVPITLEDFRELFRAVFTHGKADVKHVRALLDACCADRASCGGAPAWKASIGTHIREHIQAYSNTSETAGRT